MKEIKIELLGIATILLGIVLRANSFFEYFLGVLGWRTKSSVCSVKKSAKCDFFLNLMKKSLTFRLWQDREIHFGKRRRAAGHLQYPAVRQNDNGG